MALSPKAIRLILIIMEPAIGKSLKEMQGKMNSTLVGGREKQQRSHWLGLGWWGAGGGGEQEQMRELWKRSGLWERAADRRGGQWREKWLIPSWVTDGLHRGCGLSTRVGWMLSGGGHMERCSGRAADLKGSQDTADGECRRQPHCWAVMQPCELSQSRDKHPQGGSQRPDAQRCIQIGPKN